jgi:NAD-dependent SIR2 family protein deacetylase
MTDISTSRLEILPPMPRAVEKARYLIEYVGVENSLKQYGAFLALVNLSETPCDGLCDVLIRGKAGEILRQIVSNVEDVVY